MRSLFGWNRDQILKLSDIFSDTGLVVLATMVIPSVFDRIDEKRVLFGWTATVLLWLASLLLRRKK